MATFGGPNIVDDGLVLHLDAGNVKSYTGSGTTWVDRSGNGNNGTLVNGPTFDGGNNGSIVFDGVNDRGTLITPTVSTATSLSYTVWFKGQSSTNAVGGFGYILHNNVSNTSTGDSYLTFGIHGTTNKYYAAMDGQFNNMQTSISQNNTSIYMMTLTWDGITQKVYMNGNLENSQSLSDGFTYQGRWSSIFGLCDQRNGTYRPFEGSIYNINTYNRALTPQEILQNYNATKGRFGL